jgi:hypothetical protein
VNVDFSYHTHILESKMRIVIYLILYLIVPRVGGADVSIVFLIIPLLECIYKSKGVICIPKNARLFLILNGLALVLLTVLAVVHMKITPVHLLKPFRILITFVCLLQIFKFYKVSLSELLSVVIISSLINATFIYIQYFSPFLGFEQFSNFGSSFDIERSTPYRKSGLMTGFPTAGILSLFGFISLVLYNTVNNKRYHIVLMIFLIGTQLITSRTSLYLTLIILLLLMIKINFRYAFIIAVTAVILIQLFDGLVDERFMKTQVLMFEGINNYFEHGSFETKSSNSLFSNKHYFMPDDAFTFLLGDFKSNADTGMGLVISDVFFTRVLNGSGIISLLIYLVMYFYMIYLNFRSKMSEKVKVYIYMIYFIVFITSFKGSYIFSSTIGDITLFMFVFQLINVPKNENHLLIK